MKVLIADAFPKDKLASVAALGVEVDHRPDLPAKDLPAAARDATVLVVRSKKVAAEVFEAGGALSVVVRAGAGVNTIDVAAASRNGVYVTNCPGQNAVAVAELAIGLALALDRRIPDNVQALREGRWEKKVFSEARGLKGRTFGVLGLGAIGQAAAARARGLEMKVHAWSRSLDAARAEALGLVREESPLALARKADVLSVHLPLKPETRGLVSREVLEALRPGALFVNTARAEVVDQAALLELARAGRLRVGTDVHAGEPEGGKAEFRSELAMAARRVRHPPHRRLHRAGAGRHRRGGGAHHRRLRPHRAGAQLRERAPAHAGALPAGGAPPRPGGRHRQRAGRHPRGGHQRRSGSRTPSSRRRPRPAAPSSSTSARRPRCWRRSAGGRTR